MANVDYPEQVVKGISYMRSLDKPKRTSSVWGAVFDDGKVEVCGHMHCFGTAKNTRYLGAKWIVSRLQYNGAAEGTDYKEDIIHYFNWLFNVSPYAKVFVSKDGAQVWKDRWLVVHTDVPSNLMIAALMASRIPSESSNPMFVMKDLEEYGCPQNLGFLIGQCLAGGNLRKGSAKWGDTSAEHRCLSSGELGKNTIQAFLDGTVAKPNRKYVDKTEYNTPYTIFEMWGDRNGLSLPAFINAHFDAKDILGGREKIASLNPFKQVPEEREDLVSYSDAIKAMGVFYKRIIEEFGLNVS